MKQIILITLMFFSFNSFGQKIKIDSLETVLNNSSNEEDKANLYIKLGFNYRRSKPDKHLNYAKNALKIFKSLDNKLGVAKSYELLGSYYYFRADYEKTLLYYNKSLAIRKTHQLPIKNLYGNIAKVYKAQGKITESIAMINKALNVFLTESDDSSKVMTLITDLPALYRAQGEYQKSLEISEKILRLSISYKDTKSIGIAYQNIAIYYYDKQNFPKSLDFYLKSVKIKENTNNEFGLVSTYSNIASLYGRIGNLEKALEYFNKVLALDKKNNNVEGIASDYLNIAGIYTKQIKYELALRYFKKSLDISKTIGAKSRIAICYYNMGTIYFEQEDFTLAEKYINKSLKVSQKNKFNSNVSACNIMLGKIHLAQNDVSEAKKQYEVSQEIITQNENTGKLLSLAKLRFKIDSTQGNYLGAIKSYQDYISLKDSIFNETINKQITEIQTKYETEKKEQENKLLRNENKLKKIELKHKNNFILVLIVLGTIALIFIFLILKFWLKEKKSKKFIEDQKEKITEQNKELQKNNALIEKQNETIQFLSGDQTHMIDNLLRGLESSLIYQDTEKSIEELERENKLRITALVEYNRMLSLEIIEKDQNRIKIVPEVIFEKMLQNAQKILDINQVTFHINIELEFISAGRMLYMTRILNEVLINAYKHAYKNIEKPAFYVSLQKNDSQEIEFILADNGKGISKEYKLDNYSQGRSIIEELVDKMNGKLEVSTDYGTEYKITFT